MPDLNLVNSFRTNKKEIRLGVCNVSGTYEVMKQWMRDFLGVEEKDLPAYLRVIAGYHSQNWTELLT